MDIEESKELLKKELVNTYSEKKAKAIDVVLKELDKKDKIINEMAEHIEKLAEYDIDETLYKESKEYIIDYFTKKVEGK